MFGSEVLDVLIGLIVVLLMLSLIASAVRELIETVIKSRAVLLERGVRSLLDKDSNLIQQLYDHPLIKPLLTKNYNYKSKRWLGRGMPSYIPSRSFAAALLNIVGQPPAGAQVIRAQASFTIAELRSAAEQVSNTQLKKAVLTAVERRMRM